MKVVEEKGYGHVRGQGVELPVGEIDTFGRGKGRWVWIHGVVHCFPVGEAESMTPAQIQRFADVQIGVDDGEGSGVQRRREHLAGRRVEKRVDTAGVQCVQRSVDLVVEADEVLFLGIGATEVIRDEVNRAVVSPPRKNAVHGGDDLLGRKLVRALGVFPKPQADASPAFTVGSGPVDVCGSERRVLVMIGIHSVIPTGDGPSKVPKHMCGR